MCVCVCEVRCYCASWRETSHVTHLEQRYHPPESSSLLTFISFLSNSDQTDRYETLREGPSFKHADLSISTVAQSRRLQVRIITYYFPILVFMSIAKGSSIWAHNSMNLSQLDDCIHISMYDDVDKNEGKGPTEHRPGTASKLKWVTKMAKRRKSSKKAHWPYRIGERRSCLLFLSLLLLPWIWI